MLARGSCLGYEICEFGESREPRGSSYLLSLLLAYLSSWHYGEGINSGNLVGSAAYSHSRGGAQHSFETTCWPRLHLTRIDRELIHALACAANICSQFSWSINRYIRKWLLYYLALIISINHPSIWCRVDLNYRLLRISGIVFFLSFQHGIP